MRWIGRRNVRADDGTNPEVGIEAHDIGLFRLPPSSDFRLSLFDEAGKAIASIDLDRGDFHDLRGAIAQIMTKPKIGR